MNRTLLFILFCSLCLVMRLDAQGEKGFADRIHFPTTEKAKELIGSEDEFTSSWSQFDIDSRMGKPGSTKEELLHYIPRHVMPWESAEKDTLQAIMSRIDSFIARQAWRIPMPDSIYLLKTTGNEEGGASAYTRSNYIVIAEPTLRTPGKRLEFVIIHELFHILSRNDRNFRNAMYSIIGFEIMNPVDYPETIQELRITNPDAPQTDSYITLVRDGEEVDCMMIIYADRAFDGGSFFEYLNIGLLRLTEGKKKKPLLADGKPVIYSLDEVEGFYEQVGKNTNYIYHPEEILAMNFVFSMIGSQDMPTQALLEDIRARLKLGF